jgi:hypothetical protein
MLVNQIKSKISEDCWMWGIVTMEVVFPLYLSTSAMESLNYEEALRA